MGKDFYHVLVVMKSIKMLFEEKDSVLEFNYLLTHGGESCFF